MIRKPEIYIFDDSFSALDFKTDAKLRAALKRETKDATVLIVAQRVSTVMDADRIIVLDEGEIVGMGKHRELLNTCKVYREIVIMMLSISPLMTLICVVTLPLYVMVTKAVTSRSQKFFAGQQKALGELNGRVEEMYTGHTIVKAFGHEKKSVEQFNQINERLYHEGWKAQFISGIIMPFMGFINNIGYVFVCVVGGILVTRQTIQIGDVQAFIQYSRQFTQPIVQTANIANILQSTVASAERVFELLDEAEEILDAMDVKEITTPKGEVRFEHVRFGYEEDSILMEDLNIDVKQGQTVAIVGPTGAGKTTLVNLLMRFYEIKEGRITIDGRDI